MFNEQKKQLEIVSYQDPRVFAQECVELLERHHQASAAHTLRVVEISALAGLSLGLSKENTDLLIYEASVHDVGKRDVDARLLSLHNPTPQQIATIRDGHIKGTRERLKNSNLEPSLKAVILEDVMQHHEDILFFGNVKTPYPRNCENVSSYDGPERRKETSEPSERAKILFFADKLDRSMSGFNNVDGKEPNLENLGNRVRKYLGDGAMSAEDEKLLDVCVDACSKLYSNRLLISK